MRIVITGATSFIGHFLLEGLTRAGHDCIAVVRHSGRSKLDDRFSVKVIEKNMCDYDRMVADTGHVDCLINLAWLGTRGADRMNTDLQKSSYEYSLEAIKSFVDGGCRLVFTAGSQAEYGSIQGSIKETDAAYPNTEYGKYKLGLFEKAYQLCEENGAKLIEPRFFSLYGPGDYSGTMIVDILKKMIANEDCDLTQGIQMWDFLYITDAVNGMIALLNEKVESGAYNFASGDSRHLRDYIDEMKRVTGSKSRLNFGRIPYPETGMVSIMADITKLQRNTGWRPEVSFAKGLKEVIKTL